MIFYRRSSCPARSATGPAGSPCICVAEAADGTVVGVVPCYAKSHSQGEYVFDHGWADAYERAGGNYYPKLQVAVPFTPAHRPPAAGATRRARRRGAQCARGPARRHLQALERLLRPCHLPDRGRMADARCARLSAAHAPPVPLGERGLRQLSTPSSPRCRRASARPSAASARTRSQTASPSTG